ncbi:MAG: PadR family transcriptional regulator [Thermoanaerobaculia bacterium]
MSDEFQLNWATQLRKGVLEFAILSALAGGNRLYGYELVRKLGSIDSLVVSEGTIYPILNRLKREAYVESTIEESSEGPARKYYQLTTRGRAQLQRMTDHWKRLQLGIDTLQKGSR